VSVVVAVRDGAAHLAEALDSVLTQQPVPSEVVVVDDGSTDGTPDLLATYEASVRGVRQERLGIGAALNRGIAASSGDLVAFCDADDRWLPGRVAAQLAAFESGPEVDVVGGRVVEFLSPEAAELSGRVRVSGAPARARLLQALVVRRAALLAVGPFDESLRHGVGLDWVSRADAHGLRVAWIDDVVVERRIHRANMGHETDAARADLLAVLRRDRRRRASAPAPPGVGVAEP
jgi:glycosyltransferase involved in cell wall biosynthesis